MPISLRLPAEVESQIAGYSARLGVSKSAVIVRSIQEFLARHIQPSSLQLYEKAMRAAGVGASDDQSGLVNRDTRREAAEKRPHKLQVREALRRKHAGRSTRASDALAQVRGGVRAGASGNARTAARKSA